MNNKRYTLSQDGHDLGELPEIEGCNWDIMWDILTKAAKATGKAGRWYLYSHEVGVDWETWRKLEHFIELH